jgi:hypothetical protein
VASKATFRNCLVAMRPKAKIVDLPSTHNVTKYIHNQFVEWLKDLKKDIAVSNAVIHYLSPSIKL